MFLNGSLLGGSFLTSGDPAFMPSAYDSIQVNGELVVDKLRVLDKLLTDNEVDELSIFDEYNWIVNTLMYAEFEETLNAGNISGIETPILAFDIYRRKDDESIFTKLAELDADARDYIDYAVSTSSTYEYIAYARTATELSNPITSDPFTTDFFSWSLTNPITEEVYVFDLNINTGTINHNSDMHVYDNMYTKKPKVSFSEKDYISGSITALAGMLNCEDGTHYYPQDYLDNLKAFINDNQKKYLKSRRGDIWIVHTTNFRSAYIDEIGEQIANISFDFVEVNGSNGSDFIRLP